jgi:hypothetical protein
MSTYDAVGLPSCAPMESDSFTSIFQRGFECLIESKWIRSTKSDTRDLINTIVSEVRPRTNPAYPVFEACTLFRTVFSRELVGLVLAKRWRHSVMKKENAI